MLSARPSGSSGRRVGVCRSGRRLPGWQEPSAWLARGLKSVPKSSSCLPSTASTSGTFGETAVPRRTHTGLPC